MIITSAQKKLDQVIVSVEQIIKGKRTAIRLALATLLTRGHLLIEDIPGVGKTMLSHALANSLDSTFRRIQFTSDLLPGDILGVNIFNPKTQEFQYRQGPVFANIVLADEINRATPKTQSSLLEAMSEGQVSVDNSTYSLEPPFMVIATQNPLEHYGTFPLPESQLDRFQMRISLGYPDKAHEAMVIKGRRTTEILKDMQPVISKSEIVRLQNLVETVKMDDSILDYLQKIVEGTRTSAQFKQGASTRSAIAFYRNAQAWAMLEGRDYCIPDDVKQLAQPSLAHRVVPTNRRRKSSWSSGEAAEAISELLATIPVPR